MQKIEYYKFINKNWTEFSMEKNNNIWIIEIKSTRKICDKKFLDKIKEEIKNWWKLIKLNQ